MDGHYKFNLNPGTTNAYLASEIASGRVFVYASSLGGVNNLNAYAPNGTKLAGDIYDTALNLLKIKCETYDNFVDINKEVNLDEQLADFENYIEL